MPELPEVETVKNILKEKLVGKKILDINIYYDKIIEFPVKEFKEKLLNQTILDIKRKGKFLMFEFMNFYMLSHLRMEGKYKIRNIQDEKLKHEHISFEFEGFKLSYVDTRKFGRLYIVNKDEALDVKPLNQLGLEAWDKNLNTNYLKEKLNKNLPIKTLLLDQSIIAGIGNIYADEILFSSKINPHKVGKNLTKKELQNIIDSTKTIFGRAIELGGTTIRTYESINGINGEFQNELKVHTKDFCFVCSNKITKEKINGRSTYYCKHCQK